MMAASHSLVAAWLCLAPVEQQALSRQTHPAERFRHASLPGGLIAIGAAAGPTYNGRHDGTGSHIDPHRGRARARA